jgi:IclR family transcriptional regulator, acetate operon repressor
MLVMRPVEIALQLVELLGFHQPAGVTELARLAKLPKSTIQRNLLALEKTGWIEMRDSDHGQWTLTIRAAIAAGGRVPIEQQNMRSLAIPVMEELRRTTGETIYLSYLFNNAMVIFERLDGIKPVQHFFPYGIVYGLHASAGGNAIMAKLSPADLKYHLANPFLNASSMIPMPRAELLRELQKIRKRGYGISNTPDGKAVGAAICDPQGRPIAAISIVAPLNRVTPAIIDKWGALVADATRRIGIGTGGLAGLQGF